MGERGARASRIDSRSGSGYDALRGGGASRLRRTVPVRLNRRHRAVVGSKESLFRSSSLLLLASCVFRETSLDMSVSDPGEIAVRAGTGPSAPALPAAGPPGKVRLTGGEIPTSASTSAAYALEGVRAEDGSVRLEWDTRLPLPLGEGVTLVPASGNLHLVAPGEGPLPVSWPSAGTVRVSLCANLSPHSNRGGVQYITSVTPAAPCRTTSGGVSVPLELDAMTAAARLSRHDRPDRAAAGILLAVDLLVFGALGGPLLGVGEGTNDKPLVVSGASVLALGGAIAVLLAPTFFASTHDAPLAEPR